MREPSPFQMIGSLRRAGPGGPTASSDRPPDTIAPLKKSGSSASTITQSQENNMLSPRDSEHPISPNRFNA